MYHHKILFFDYITMTVNEDGRNHYDDDNSKNDKTKSTREWEKERERERIKMRIPWYGNQTTIGVYV